MVPAVVATALVPALTPAVAQGQPSAAPSTVTAAEPAPAILSLSLNGAARGEVYVYLDGDDVLVRTDDLRAAGLGALLGRRRLLDGDEYVSLASMDPPVRARLDEREMTLGLEVDPKELPLTRLDLGESVAPADMILGEDTSLFFNYAANWTIADGRDGYDGYFESGLSSGPWLLYSSAMANRSAQARGLSNLTYDDRDRLRRFVVGDTVAAGDSLGGSALFGGVQLARSFELDPYRVFRPTLGQTGVATMPSTAEIYVNGVLVRRAELPPGPFSATDLPATTGAGDTRVVVRDALGREQTYESSYYLPANLLTPGLSEYSYTLGFRRLDLGEESWSYGAAALIAQHRLGLTSWFTGGLRLEAGRHLVSGGPSVTLGLPVGELTLAAAGSRQDDRSGGAASISYGYDGRRVNLGVLGRALTDEYATASLAAEDDRTSLELGVSLGVPVARRVIVTVQAQHFERRDRGEDNRLAVTSSINLARTWQLSVSASATRDAMEVVRLGAFAGLTMVIDQQTTATASQRVERGVGARGLGDAPAPTDPSDPSGPSAPTDPRLARDTSAESAIEVQRTLPAATGYGYRLRGLLAEGGRSQGEATVDAQGERGRATASVMWDGERTTGRVGVAGGVVVIGGRVKATRPVQRGYALIRVPGAAGVRGYLDNQLVGRTDARGDLVVPNLLPYYANRLSIDDSDLPMDTMATTGEQRVASRNRGGVVVRFVAERMQAVRGSVVIDDGRTSAAWGELHVVTGPGKREVSPIGGQGQFELANLPPGRHRAELEYAGGTCTVALDVPARGQPIEELGALPCMQPEEARR